MLAPSFDALSHKEKVDFIGKLTHVCQSSEFFYDLAKSLIGWAETSGMFDKVIINPNGEESTNNSTSPADEISARTQ